LAPVDRPFAEISQSELYHFGPTPDHCRDTPIMLAVLRIDFPMGVGHEHDDTLSAWLPWRNAPNNAQ